MVKRVLKFAGIGFLVGVALCNFITIIASDGALPVTPALVDKIGGARLAMLLQSLLSGLYGAICMAGVLLYDTDRLPLAAATLLHCLMCIIPFAPLSLLLGWSDGIEGVLIMALFQLAAFFLVWLIMYARYRAEIKKMNEMQKNNLDKSTTEEE